jgi:hypothetical protein
LHALMLNITTAPVALSDMILSSPTTAASASPVPSSGIDHPNPHKFPAAAIAAIVVAAMLSFSLVVGLLSLLCHRRHQGRRKKSSEEPNNNNNRQSTTPSFYSPTAQDRVSCANPPLHMAEHLYSSGRTMSTPIRYTERQHVGLPLYGSSNMGSSVSHSLLNEIGGCGDYKEVPTQPLVSQQR